MFKKQLICFKEFTYRQTSQLLGKLENPVWTQKSVSSSWPQVLVASIGRLKAAFSNSGMHR